MATRLWNFLTTDHDLAALETADRAADAADAVLALAKVLTEERPDLRRVAALVGQLDSLLEAINAPLGKLMGATVPFIGISTGLLKVYGETAKTEPTLAQATALISQAAYLESLREFVKQHPKIEQWLIAKDSTPQARTITLPVKALGIFELTDQDARLASLHFHRSALAGAFSSALQARLVQLGTTPEQADRITKVVAKNTHRHMKTAIADAGISLKYQLDGDRL
ncbi:hypothetical protein VB780_12455 [Leptolyngbya sp. CCNP1308]|uniref:hypothetical protein n=1 Tax=Leptolyngbya sp. CCNP1308 TaxID=3110255 RepID=UPI002B1F7821|nr:hypothetical protein [Leptolyngbya sp. CCNP1308]MEA5449386.1 hypothetical protein [Leptolyngbya sp. CCNP1308]